MTKQRLLVTNTVSNIAVNVWNQSITFLLLPMMVAHTGTEAFGIYVLASTFAGFFAAFDFGIARSLVKYTAELGESKDRSQFVSILRISLCFFAGVSLVAAATTYLAARWGSAWLGTSPELQEQTRQALTLTALFALPTWILKPFESVVEGLQLHRIKNLLAGSVNLGLAVSTVLALRAGYGIITLVLLMNCANLCFSAANAALALSRLRLAPGDSPWRAPAAADFGAAKGILNYTSNVFLIQLSTVLMFHADRLIIATLLPLSALTYYHVVTKPFYFVRSVNNWILSAIMPAVAKGAADSDAAFLSTLLHRGTKYYLCVIVFLGGVLVALARPLLTTWMGPEYGEQAFNTQLFLFGYLVQAPIGVMVQFAFGTGRIEGLRRIVTAGVFVNLCLSVALTPRLGITGVILGTVGQYLGTAPFMWRLFHRDLHVEWPEFFRTAVGPVYLAGTAAAAGAALVAASSGGPGWPLLLGSGAAGGVIFLLFAGFLVLDASERSGIANWFSPRPQTGVPS